MAVLAKLPVVVGSSMSGLLISDALSREGIEHYLIGGDRPHSVPRLGESMNECASPELWRYYARLFPQHFYPKNHISLLNGPFASMLHFGNPACPFTEVIEEFANLPDEFMPLRAKYLTHIDRVGFDQSLYDKIRANGSCRFVQARVTSLRHDVDTDCVERIDLDNGETIESPPYVFDASGPRGAVAAAAGVGTRYVSTEQRVVWTHYRRDSSRTDDPWWMFGTNLLRLDHANDTIDGISWMIPLGNTVSVGISVDACDDAVASRDANEVMLLLGDAYARRGVDYQVRFPAQLPNQEITHRYFIRDRAYGANWVLAGGTFVQIWFPSSSGVWAATAAAGMVKELIDRPQYAGAKYESIMRGLLKFHGSLDEMIHGSVFGTRTDVYRFWARWVSLIPKRVSDYLLISKNKLEPGSAIFRGLELWCRAMARSPRLTLFFGGLGLIRCHHCSELQELAAAFPDYRMSARFRLRNFVRGVHYMIAPSLGGHPVSAMEGDPAR